MRISDWSSDVCSSDLQVRGDEGLETVSLRARKTALSAATMTDAPDYRDTVFLPKTDFPMKAGLPQKEPAILAKWLENDLEGQIREARKDRAQFILHRSEERRGGKEWVRTVKTRW